MRTRHWYIVIKYTDFDYSGTRVDAHYVVESQEAMLKTAQGPMKPGEKLEVFGCSASQSGLKPLNCTTND